MNNSFFPRILFPSHPRKYLRRISLLSSLSPQLIAQPFSLTRLTPSPSGPGRLSVDSLGVRLAQGWGCGPLMVAVHSCWACPPQRCPAVQDQGTDHHCKGQHCRKLTATSTNTQHAPLQYLILDTNCKNLYSSTHFTFHYCNLLFKNTTEFTFIHAVQKLLTYYNTHFKNTHPSTAFILTKEQVNILKHTQ